MSFFSLRFSQNCCFFVVLVFYSLDSRETAWSICVLYCKVLIGSIKACQWLVFKDNMVVLSCDWYKYSKVNVYLSDPYCLYTKYWFAFFLSAFPLIATTSCKLNKLLVHVHFMQKKGSAYLHVLNGLQMANLSHNY